VAQTFASLGVFHPGRIFLGLGTGEAVNEQAATGQWGKYAERAERLIEAVTIIRQLWAGEWVNFNGKYFQTKDVHLYDGPAQAVPLYIASAGPKSAKLAGQYADGWITHTKDLMDPKMRDAFSQGVKAVGKTESQMEVLIETFVVVGGSQKRRKPQNSGVSRPIQTMSSSMIHGPFKVMLKKRYRWNKSTRTGLSARIQRSMRKPCKSCSTTVRPRSLFAPGAMIN
jgi:alkanesulfonate monooxygenase SsuD/methylene tetrahydromethanopterin reductase-like flavin-dependent oxidoreductase (luciferase family)